MFTVGGIMAKVGLWALVANGLHTSEERGDKAKQGINSYSWRPSHPDV